MAEAGSRSGPGPCSRETFSQKLREIKSINCPDMPLKKLATECHCSPTTISDIIHGKRWPRREQAESIVRVLGGDWSEVGRLWQDLYNPANSYQDAPKDVGDEETRQCPGTRIMASSMRPAVKLSISQLVALESHIFDSGLQISSQAERPPIISLQF